MANITDILGEDTNTIHSPVAESIKNAMKLIIREASYMEDTGEEFSDPEKYSALVRILNASSAYFRNNLHI